MKPRETIAINLTRDEIDCLHSLLVHRRHDFVRLCQLNSHCSPTIQQYITELNTLESKLMQVPLAEYLALDSELDNNICNSMKNIRERL